MPPPLLISGLKTCWCKATTTKKRVQLNDQKKKKFDTIENILYTGNSYYIELMIIMVMIIIRNFKKKIIIIIIIIQSADMVEKEK